MRDSYKMRKIVFGITGLPCVLTTTAVVVASGVDLETGKKWISEHVFACLTSNMGILIAHGLLLDKKLSST